MCVCVSVCLFFVPYALPQFWADLHEIWHVASLYPYGHGRLVSATWAQFGREMDQAP